MSSNNITFFQAIGKASNAAVLTLLRQVLLFLPLVLVLPLIFTESIQGIFYAQLITDVVVLILAVVFMAGAFGKMKKEERNMKLTDLHSPKAV